MKYINAILCAALILAGCSNILAPSGGSQNDLKESGVKITVSGDQAANPRTLFPTANFTKYVLSFSGPTSHDPITLANGETSKLVNDLANGTWTITATGYVMINGTEYPAVEGSKNITVTGGALQSVNIPLSAKQEGAQGYFSYTVSFPSSRVNSASLEIYSLSGGDDHYKNLFDNPSGSIFLDPGYYRMTISLSTGYQIAGITEIVHIYSNMQTQANYTFTDADFTDFITLSGTLNVKVNGQVPPHVRLYVYLDEHYQNYLTNIFVNRLNNTWSIRLAAFDTETPLYFKVEATYNGEFSKGIGIGARVKDKDISGITLGPVDFSMITLNGTVDIQVTGAVLRDAYVQVYTGTEADHFYEYLAGVRVNLTDGSWLWNREPSDNPTNLYFEIEIYTDNDQWFNQRTNKSITLKDQNKSINLGTVQFNFITLSGTLNVTYNDGNSPYYVQIRVIDQEGYSLGNIGVMSPGADEPWSMSLRSSADPINIRFMVEGRDDNWRRIFVKYSGNYTVTNESISGININLGDIPHPDTPVDPVPLAETVWVNGTIDDSYVMDWYSISVSAGTTYYLWFNNQYPGDGSQSLYGEVYAKYGDDREIFYRQDAWYDPAGFTADSNGTVYVRVRGRWWESYTGTYELIYSTAANRPVRGVTNYVVTFNTNGGSAAGGGVIPSRNVVSGAKLNKPADPVKDGFRFGGWYKELALTTPWNFATDTVSGKTTLYAKWNPKVPGTIVVAFEGFGDESIDLTVSTASDISQSKGEQFTVTVEGEGYFQFYIDGNYYGNSWGDIYIRAGQYAVGIHTLSVVITRYGKPYSKELTFRVVH